MVFYQRDNGVYGCIISYMYVSAILSHCRLFTDICKVAEDCDEILFGPDGSWNPLAPPGKDTKFHPSAEKDIRQSPVKGSPIKTSHGLSRFVYLSVRLAVSVQHWLLGFLLQWWTITSTNRLSMSSC